MTSASQMLMLMSTEQNHQDLNIQPHTRQPNLTFTVFILGHFGANNDPKF